MQVQTMADRTAEFARACMVNRTRVSPFESASGLVNIHRLGMLMFCPEAAAREGFYFRGGVRTVSSHFQLMLISSIFLLETR